MSTWIKFCLALLLLAWASIFHASNMDRKAALEGDAQPLQRADELLVNLASDWNVQSHVMGNRIVARRELRAKDQSIIKVLLMISNQGLKLDSRQTLQTSASRRSAQICYHASQCAVSEFKPISTAGPRGLIGTVHTQESAGEKTYVLFVAASPSGDHWSVLLSADHTNFGDAKPYFDDVVKTSIRFKK